jgi:hypothetical protein
LHLSSYLTENGERVHFAEQSVNVVPVRISVHYGGKKKKALNWKMQVLKWPVLWAGLLPSTVEGRNAERVILKWWSEECVDWIHVLQDVVSGKLVLPLLKQNNTA